MAKAWNITYLDTNQILEICLPKILNLRFNEMLSYEKGMIEGKDIEFLHNMRISSRRVQAVLKAFRDYYPPNIYRKHYMHLRTLIRALGVVRHYDVFINMLEKYKQTLPENKKDGIELLIIRQKSLRSQKRKELLDLIKILNKRKFKETFRNFISDVV